MPLQVRDSTRRRISNKLVFWRITAGPCCSAITKNVFRLASTQIATSSERVEHRRRYRQHVALRCGPGVVGLCQDGCSSAFSCYDIGTDLLRCSVSLCVVSPVLLDGADANRSSRQLIATVLRHSNKLNVADWQRAITYHLCCILGTSGRKTDSSSMPPTARPAATD